MDKPSSVGIYRLTYLFLGVLVVFVYLLLLLIYAENIPFTDDLAVLASLYDIHHEPDWYLKYKTLFSFHNEHRIVIPRLITILLYYSQGRHINIAWWIVLGNSLLFLILYLYYKAGFDNHRKELFIPVLLFILQPMHYELMYWGMAALQNIGVITLSTIAFYLLAYKDDKLLALGLAVLAVFTSANGVFVFLIGIPLLLYKREWRDSILWILVGATCAFLYWYGFSAAENSGKSVDESFQIFRFINTFISLVGGIAYTQTYSFLSLFLGLSILASLAFVGYYRFIYQPIRHDKSQQFLLSCFCFILLTIAAISLGRDMNSILLVSRYKLYSAMALALTYSLLLTWIENRQSIFKLAALTGFLFLLTSYARYTIMFDIHSRLLFSHFFNWRYSGKLDIYPPFAETYYSDHWTKLFQSGEYSPPKGAVEKSERIRLRSNQTNLVKASFSITDQVVSINSIALPVNEYYALRRSQQKMAIYPLNKSSFYNTWFSSSQVDYSASINRSYWLSSPDLDLFITPLH